MTPAPPPPPRDRTVALLVAGLLVYTVACMSAAIWLPGNEKVYALLAGILGNFSGALFMRLKG